MAESKFKRMVGKLEGKGHSADSATRIAAAIGREKYGAEGMAKKSAASRREHERSARERRLRARKRH